MLYNASLLQKLYETNSATTFLRTLFLCESTLRSLFSFHTPGVFRFRAGTVFTPSGGTLRTQLLPMRLRVKYTPLLRRPRGREASGKKKKKKEKRFSLFTLSSFYRHYYYYSLLLHSFSSLANPLSFSSLSFSLSWSRRSRRE